MELVNTSNLGLKREETSCFNARHSLTADTLYPADYTVHNKACHNY